YCSCPSPALPPFPTRRSSDLARMKSTRSKVISSPASCATKYIAITPTSATIDPMRMYSVSFIDAYSRVTFQPQVAMSRYIGKMRSEEHTTELQSREDLVCRLL